MNGCIAEMIILKLQKTDHEVLNYLYIAHLYYVKMILVWFRYGLRYILYALRLSCDNLKQFLMIQVIIEINTNLCLLFYCHCYKSMVKCKKIVGNSFQICPILYLHKCQLCQILLHEENNCTEGKKSINKYQSETHRGPFNLSCYKLNDTLARHKGHRGDAHNYSFGFETAFFCFFFPLSTSWVNLPCICRHNRNKIQLVSIIIIF